MNTLFFKCVFGLLFTITIILFIYSCFIRPFNGNAKLLTMTFGIITLTYTVLVGIKQYKKTGWKL